MAIFYTKMTNLIQFTMNVRKYSPPTFPFVGSSTQNASDQSASCIHFSFLNSPLLPTQTDKILTDFNDRFIQLYLSNHSELDTSLLFCRKKRGNSQNVNFIGESKRTEF